MAQYGIMDAMKLLFYLLLAAAAIYVSVRVAPVGTAHRGLEAVGLANFFERTIPDYLREKLTIGEDPAAKRRKLVRELAEKISVAERELEAAVPVLLDGQPQKLPSAEVIRERAEKTREALAKSEEILTKLEAASAGEGVIRATAGRILGAVLPTAAPVPSPGTNGGTCPCVGE